MTDNRRDPRQVALEAEEIAEWLDAHAELFTADERSQQVIKRAAAFIREGYPTPPDPLQFFVGVQDGKPVIVETGDHVGDCKEVSLYPKAEDASARYHNVRRVLLYVDPTPVRAPEDWGAVEGGSE